MSTITLSVRKQLNVLFSWCMNGLSNYDIVSINLLPIISHWAGCVNCSHIQLQHDAALVLNQPVQYHCTINGSTILNWRVLRNDGSELGSIRYVSSVNQAPNSIGGLFTARQSLTSIGASISFTVESDIDGYTVICEDELTMENERFTISLSSGRSGIIIVAC